MSKIQISQKVIDFEYSRINAPFQTLKKQQQDSDKNQDRFSQWNLATMIKDLNIPDDGYSVYWVGYGQHTLIQAFIYCLLVGSKNGPDVDNIKFAKAKYSLYQICQKYLTMPEQKQLVENLCYSQYTKNMANYLNKNYILEELITKIFRTHVESFKQYLLPMQELKLFSLNFTFMTFEIVSDSIALLKNYNQKYYIMREKQCVFVVEVYGDKGAMNSSVKSNETNGAVNASFSNSNSQGKSGKNIQCSTPKFLPPQFGEPYKVSSHRNPERVGTPSQIQETQVTNFEEKQHQFTKQEHKKVYYIGHKDNKPSKKSIPKNKNKKQSNFSLRNTIDMHIANLQKYDIRSRNSKRRPKGSFFKDNSREKQKIKINTNESFASFLQSRSSEVKRTTPSPEANSGQDSFFVTKRNSYNIFPTARNNYSPVERYVLNNSYKAIPPPRVSFTYHSP